MKLFVEDFLPREFLLWQGTFVQTCAHIEKHSWNTIMYDLEGRGYEGYSEDQMMVMRKVNTPLKKEFRKFGQRYGGEIARRCNALVSGIERNEIYRHMAVHGTWKAKSVGVFEVQYYYQNKSRTVAPRHQGVTEWRSFSRPFTEDKLDGLLIEANRMVDEIGEIFGLSRQQAKKEQRF